jgi:Ca2+-binding RTX toxin-like protein
MSALTALSSSAQTAACKVNGVEVPDDPVLIEGTSGADTIDCSSSTKRHEIYGLGGIDTLIGSDFDDFIAGGGNGDFIYGGMGDDAIDGGADDDHIYGEGGHDTIFGGVGASPASGVGCELQTAFIAAGSSYLTKGGSGDDTIYGGEGNDCINAGSGEDEVYGQAGNDTLLGGNHGDMLHGGPGDDHIDGGWHSDTCVGGGGNDNYFNCELADASIPLCGDGTCDTGEDSCSCSEDCGAPPAIETSSCNDGMDNDCDSLSDCADPDCAGDQSCSCGNDGMCDLGEDCLSCPQDCSGKQKGKPSRRYCCGDGTAQSAEGDGAICNGNF